jgi:hypothetical protein
MGKRLYWIEYGLSYILIVEVGLLQIVYDIPIWTWLLILPLYAMFIACLNIHHTPRS